MLPDPLTVASGFLTNPGLVAVSREKDKSVYSLVTSGGSRYGVTISHLTNKGRRRTMVRLDLTEMKSDPYVTAQNVEDNSSVYLVIDRNLRLTSDAGILATIKELIGVMALATAANVTTTRTAQIVAGES